MARIRTIKPEFFRHADLFEAEKETGLPLRLAFAGLWTAADREGRFKWKPRELKLDCLPHDDVDFSRVLDSLAEAGVIVKYEVEGETFGFIPNWKKHQVINQREAASVLPAPATADQVHAHARTEPHVHTPRGVNIPEPLRATIIARDKKCLRCNNESDLTVDHIFPQSIGGTHAITNLRTLCRGCNSRRPVAGQPLLDDLASDGLTMTDMPRMCMHVQVHGEGKGKEGKGKEYRSVADAPRPSDKFEEFWKAYPRRDGPNPRKPAEQKFNALVKTGIDPAAMIAAAKKLAADETARGKVGTQFIPQAITWLNQQRWADGIETAAEAERAAEILKSKFYAKADSPQLDAWDAYSRSVRGRNCLRDKNGGWFFDTEWPPDYQPPIATGDVPVLRMKSM